MYVPSVAMIGVVILNNPKMKTLLQNRLSTLEEKHCKDKRTSNKRLRVFYGWSRVNKIRKKEAISIVFENDTQRDSRTMKFINKMQHTVHIRDQTDNEMKGADKAIRMFTEYSVFMNDKKVQGSLELALQYNSEADKNNVSIEDREIIFQKLRDYYLTTHPDYREPTVQLKLKFD